jgi:drug/metabolite transporter (DMT)-like permease
MATTTGERASATRIGAGATARRAVLLLVAANVLWAGTYTAGKIALRELSPVELNALRFALAALILSPALLRGWRRIPRDRATLMTLAQLVVLGWVLNKTLEYVGLSLSTASDTALLISTESLFTALLSWLLLRERVRPTGVASLIVGLLGAYLIVERGLLLSLGGAGGAGRIVGDVLIVCSLLVEAVYTVRGKSTLVRVPPLLFTSATITGSLIFWLPAGAINVMRDGWPQVSLAGWLGVLYMAAIATALCYWLWFRGLRSVDGSAAAPTLFIQPLVGTVLAVLLLHDELSWATLAGGGLIGVSLVLVIWSSRRPAEIVASEATP